MDYKKIITRYNDSGMRDYFHDFLCKTYNELKTNHFSPEEFINGCMFVVNDLEREFNRELEIKAREFKARYEQAKKGIGIYKSKPIPFPDEEEEVDMLHYLKAQSESPEKFIYARISDWETSRLYDFKITEIKEIKNAVEKCYKTISNDSFNNTPHIIEQSNKTVKKKYKSGYYVLAYIYDMTVTNQKILLGEKAEMERIGNAIFRKYDAKNAKGKYYSDNTFYQSINDLYKNNIFMDEKYLTDNFKDWPEELLKLCKHPKEVKEFINTKIFQGK